MRFMSFSMTVDQMRARMKTVTRRLGWKNAKVGDRVMAVEKYRGVRVEDRVELGVIEFTEVARERLYLGVTSRHMDQVREGYPDMDPSEFVTMFCEKMRCHPADVVTRIAFQFVEKL